VDDPIRVLILDEDETFRQRVRVLLEKASGILVVGDVQDSQQAPALVHDAQPDVVLLCIARCPEDGLQTVAQIAATVPDTRIIVLNENEQKDQVLEAFRRGAWGHLERGLALGPKVISTVRATRRGEAILSPDVAGHILDEVAREKRKDEE